MHSTARLEDSYLGSGKILAASINKHGKSVNIKEILEWCENRDDLKRREREIVTLDSLSDKLCMNLKVGGEGGYPPLTSDQVQILSKIGRSAFLTKLQTDEAFKESFSEKVSEANRIGHSLGKLKSLGETCNWSGRTHRKETIDKMKDSHVGLQTGSKNSQFGTCWIKHKELGTLKINKTELESYLSAGWVRGR